MAVYAETDELAAFLRIKDAGEDVHLGALLEAASRAIDSHCGWSFDTYTSSDSASPRVFAAEHSDVCYIDPFATTTDLVVKTDTSADGTFNETWSASDYQLEPLNQRRSGLSDHPYFRIRAIESKRFPCAKRAQVQVTAKWGWETIPASVREACKMHAARLHERRNMPAGIVAGEGFVTRSSLGIDPDVGMLLSPYVRPDKWT